MRREMVYSKIHLEGNAKAKGVVEAVKMPPVYIYDTLLLEQSALVG
jgi:hypothetical protein